MSFNEYEISNQEGRPVYLYDFRLGTLHWRYTSADRDIEWGFEEDEVTPLVWQAKAIFHEQITQGGSDNNDLQVPMQRDIPLVPLFRVNAPMVPLWLTVRRRHRDDPSTDAPISWIGTVGNIKDEDEATARAYCNNIAATFDRNGLRLFWGRGCPHSLYGRGCWVDKADHAYTATVASFTPVQVTIAEEIVPDEGSFSGGFMEWTRPDGIMERRGIEAALDESTFAILGQIDEIADETEITLYPGCARTTANCKLFDNLPNYGGFPHLPGKSPFDGTPVF